MRRALVCGAGGFIGHHLVRRLKAEGCWVRGVDLKPPVFSATEADEFVICDLREPYDVGQVLDGRFRDIFQLAADMGGAGFVFTGDNDADILSNNALININVLARARVCDPDRIFFASSACVYAEDPLTPYCIEGSEYPANPDSDYGWEKLFSERLYAAHHRNYNIGIRIGRFHNIFGPEGTWQGGREKAPAAICRKIAEAHDGDEIEIWGDGQQQRSFLYIDEAIEGMLRLMASRCPRPLNIGSDEMVSISLLVGMVASIAGKRIGRRYVPGPQGVRARTSDNSLIEQELGWRPTTRLYLGLEKTYRWVEEQVRREQKVEAA